MRWAERKTTIDDELLRRVRHADPTEEGRLLRVLFLRLA